VQDAFQCPFFQGETIFLRCMKNIVEWWREPARRFQKEVRRLLEVELSPIDESAVGVSKILRDSVTEHWAEHVDVIMGSLAEALKQALDESLPFGTANHYLYSKYMELQVMPDDVIESTINAIAAGEVLNNRMHESQNFQTTIGAIRKALVGVREKAVAEDRHKSLHEQVAKRVLHAVKAAWAVEKKTITDAFLKKTRDIVVTGRDEWVSTTLLINSKIRTCAVEDADVEAQRKHNTEVIAAMKVVLEELAELKGEVSGDEEDEGGDADGEKDDEDEDEDEDDDETL